MTDKYELNLLDNAIDYLNEAMKYYQEAKNSEDGARLYKFCILHCVSFAELFLKYHIFLIDKTRIYKQTNKNRTVGLYDLFSILKELKIIIPDFLEEEIKHLADTRNEAIHYQVSYSVENVHNQIGKLLYVLVEFDEKNKNIGIIEKAEKKFQPLLHSIREGAITKEAEQVSCYSGRYIRDLDCDGININTGMMCESCGKETLYSDEYKYACSFCGEIFKYRVECNRCGTQFDSYKEYIGPVSGLCDYCNYQHERFWTET